jgi:hypothetical protein
MTLQQIHNVNHALGNKWFQDTTTPLNTDELWGRIFIFATGSATDLDTVALVVAHAIGDRAVREFDPASTLEDCNRSARHYQELCKAALAL